MMEGLTSFLERDKNISSRLTNDTVYHYRNSDEAVVKVPGGPALTNHAIDRETRACFARLLAPIAIGALGRGISSPPFAQPADAESEIIAEGDIGRGFDTKAVRFSALRGRFELTE